MAECSSPYTRGGQGRDCSIRFCTPEQQDQTTQKAAAMITHTENARRTCVPTCWTCRSTERYQGPTTSRGDNVPPYQSPQPSSVRASRDGSRNTLMKPGIGPQAEGGWRDGSQPSGIRASRDGSRTKPMKPGIGS